MSGLDSLSLTWTHFVSLGLSWIQLVSLGFTWAHLDSLGLEWPHLVCIGEVMVVPQSIAMRLAMSLAIILKGAIA